MPRPLPFPFPLPLPPLETIAALRATIGDHPLGTFVVLAIVWSVLLRLTRRDDVLRRRSNVGPTVAAIGGLMAMASLVKIAGWYAVIPSYYDFAEPTVAAIAWLFNSGQPIYHAFAAAERYSHMYGPAAFLFPASVLGSHPTIFATKLMGLRLTIFTLGVVAFLLHDVTRNFRRTLALTGLFALLCLMFRNAAFWIRPDSTLLLFASLALASYLRNASWLGAIFVGVCTGMLVSLKLTGFLYVLPALTLLASRDGLRFLLIALFTAAVVVAYPFVVYGNVSFTNYLTWVKLSASNGLSWSLLRHNLEWALFLLVPMFPIRPRKELLALVIGVAGVVVAAAKPGAGPYHLLPFLPTVIYLFARDAADAFPLRPAFVAATLVVASLQQAYFIGVLQAADDVHADAEQDVNSFLNANPGHTVAMGYANAGERWTYVRPAIVFRTGRYPIDAPAVQEYGMSGLPMPTATIDALRRCDTEFWLIPKGATPFAGPNKYPSTNFAPLFPEPFTRAFFDTYHHDGTHDTRYFDVWSCRQAASTSAR